MALSLDPNRGGRDSAVGLPCDGHMVASAIYVVMDILETVVLSGGRWVFPSFPLSSISADRLAFLSG